jgi:hypothetical protein
MPLVHAVEFLRDDAESMAKEYRCARVPGRSWVPGCSYKEIVCGLHVKALL